MRIGIDYTSAVRQRAGIGRYCRELIQALVKLDAENEYVLLIAGRLTADESAELDTRFAGHANVVLRPIPLSDRWLNRLWHRLQLPLPVELFTGPLDIFHSPDFTLPPVRRAKTLVQIHDLSFLRVPKYADPKLQSYLKTVVPRCAKHADLILADSQHTKQDIVSLFRIPSDDVMVILGGVESRFHPIADLDRLARAQERYDLPERFILGLGTLEPRKNFAGLIEAYHQLYAQQELVQHLVIGGGKGWLYGGIFERIKTLDLQDRVHLIGFVADNDLPSLYTLADLFVFPSFYEGFGLPVLEAMACGTPVVSSNAASLPEVVGKAGLLVNPTDTDALAEAMDLLLSNAALRQQYIAQGKIQARRFTWKRAAYQLLLAYQHV
jgi:glycosyltransferase involved in cell wall biosynthesis